jgi:hypothetical protein
MHPNERKYEKMVETFERAQPDASQLERGDLKETDKVITNMGSWQGEIAGNAKTRAEGEAMAKRIDVARRRYRVAAAKLVHDPTVALALILPELGSDDPDVLAVLKQRSGELLAERQAEHDRLGTYRRPREHRDTSSSTTIVDGQVVDQRSSVGMAYEIGNCVVASRAFGSDHDTNPELALVVHGAQPVFVRCYTERTVLEHRGGALVATVNGKFTAEAIQIGQHTTTRGSHVDFSVPARYVNIAGHEAAYLPIELVYVWAPDDVVVADREGKLRLRPDWQRQVLAQGAFVHMD